MMDLSLAACLETAGLEMLEDDAVGDVPLAVASLATSFRPEDGREDEIIMRVNPRLVQQVNGAWFRMASSHGLFDAGGEFLIMINGGEGGERSRWARVRLLSEWNIAGAGQQVLDVLGSMEGCPEFVTMPVRGEFVLRATTYQEFVSVIFAPNFREVQWVREYMSRRAASPRVTFSEKQELFNWLVRSGRS